MHKLDLGLYSHPKEFGGNGVRTHVNSKGKNPLYRKTFPERKIEPTTLHQAGQRAQHTTNELFRPPHSIVIVTHSQHQAGQRSQHTTDELFRPLHSIVTPRQHQAGQRAQHTTNELFRPLHSIVTPRQHQAGQRAQHTTNELFRPPHSIVIPSQPVLALTPLCQDWGKVTTRLSIFKCFDSPRI